MVKLKIGYIISVCITGLILFLNFLTSLPDGKLHLVVCDVGQGDAIYIRFPDGRDMLVDGGPNNAVISCLSQHMPFWDRTLDIVLLTHPEKDHLQGLLTVMDRYEIGYMVRSDVSNTSDGFTAFQGRVRAHAIQERLVSAGEQIRVGDARISVIWPSLDQTYAMSVSKNSGESTAVLGASSEHRNDGSLVLWLTYGQFDAWLSGDADMRTESKYRSSSLSDRSIEVLKVPHHGSATGMSSDYLDWLDPQLALVSVGRNTYGHPSPIILSMLADKGVRVLRTDTHGDIEIISDGLSWYTRTELKLK